MCTKKFLDESAVTIDAGGLWMVGVVRGPKKAQEFLAGSDPRRLAGGAIEAALMHVEAGLR